VDERIKKLNPNDPESYLKYAAICELYGKTEEAIYSLNHSRRTHRQNLLQS